MAYVNLSHMPDANREYVVNLDRLDGGLNIDELPFRIKNNESPAMKNMFWRDGILCARDGQEWVIQANLTADPAWEWNRVYERLFHGFVVVAVMDASYYAHFYYANPNAENPVWKQLGYFEFGGGGTFFRYGEYLYYKGESLYLKFSVGADPQTSEPILTQTIIGDFGGYNINAYTPVTVLNASPDDGAGDLYQPENRINPAKTVKYNIPNPAVADYYLPVKGIDSVDEVIVRGTPQTVGTDYTVDLTNGKVTFTTAPQPSNPPANNEVVITYSKANTDAYNSVMSCLYAATYGGTGDLCVVFGGSNSGINPQLNAIFWNGNSDIEMDPTYFPMDQYQLVGDSSNPVTGFGEQQSFLVVFQEHSVGRCKADYTELNGRTVVDLPYVQINDKIGCDCPDTIQLIENNLVWCNAEQGVHFLKDSSYAYENNIVCISRKINGPHVPEGLLPSTKGKWMTSHDDTRRYWLICPHDGKAWVWDYEHTSYKDPSWYPFTNIYASGLISEDDDIWGLHRTGSLTHFTRNYTDFDTPIELSYRFATQSLGGYDRLKNVNSVIICVRPDTNSVAELTYITDYEVRKDKTLLMRLVWRLVPRDLHFRSLAVNNIGAWVFRRRPMCRRVKHFTMQLDNALLPSEIEDPTTIVGKDMSIVSAQIFYNYQGRLR